MNYGDLVAFSEVAKEIKKLPLYSKFIGANKVPIQVVFTDAGFSCNYAMPKDEFNSLMKEYLIQIRLLIAEKEQSNIFKTINLINKYDKTNQILSQEDREIIQGLPKVIRNIEISKVENDPDGKIYLWRKENAVEMIKLVLNSLIVHRDKIKKDILANERNYPAEIDHDFLIYNMYIGINRLTKPIFQLASIVNELLRNIDKL